MHKIESLSLGGGECKYLLMFIRKCRRNTLHTRLMVPFGEALSLNRP